MNVFGYYIKENIRGTLGSHHSGSEENYALFSGLAGIYIIQYLPTPSRKGIISKKKKHSLPIGKAYKYINL